MMNKFICTFDVETTGLNSKEDFIIQLAVIKFSKNDFSRIDSKVWYIKPAHNYTISPEAEKVHGLSKDFIEANGVYLKEIIPIFKEMVKDSDYLTYNGNNFDVKFLYEEFKRWDDEFPIEGKKFYDVFAMECRFFPRNLSSVYKKYTGEEIINAHDALSDVNATTKVFEEQLKQHNLSFNDIDEFQENSLLTPDGSIRNTAAPGDPLRIVFSIGKYKDSEFMDIAKKDPSYIKWYMNNIATEYTEKILKEYYIKNR